MQPQLDVDGDGDVGEDVHGHGDVVRVERVDHVVHGDRETQEKYCRVSVVGYVPDGSWADEVVLVAVVVAVVALQSVEHLRGTYQIDDYPDCKFEQTVASIHCGPDKVPDAGALDRHILMYADRTNKPKWDRALVAN